MKIRSSKVLALLTTLMLFLSLTAILPKAFSQAATVIRVEPYWNEFGNPEGDPIPIPGTQFTVTVTVYDVPALYGYDLKFRWNNTYINYVNHTVHAKWTLEIKDDPYPTEGWYWIAYSKMAPESPASGTVPIFSMTFEIIKQPYDFQTGGPGVDPIDTFLDFISTDLSDPDGQPIPHDVEPATVRIWEQKFALPLYPTIKVLPAKIENLPECTNFDVEVWIVNVNSYYDIAGFDITLNFDPTLIEAVDITEGDFLASYASSTFVILEEIDNNVGTARFALVQIPPRTMFGAPSSGILFKVTFHVIFESTVSPPPECLLTLDPSDIALFPHPEILAPPYNGLPWSVALDHFKEPGRYIAKYKALGRAIDLYVADFPYPFNGQGPNRPSEGYPPQKMVNLRALVTYNLWPVQYKPVTFEIHDPQGRLVAVRTALTNANGIASVSYRLPWPCEQYPDVFGVWTVKATVDVYCEVVNDTLQFKLWWPLELLSVEPLKDSYEIFEHMSFKVTMKTCFVMSYNATIVLTVYDEVGQPIGHKVVTLTYGLNDIEKWCQWAEYEIIIECIEIPKWSAPGQATVYVVSLSNLPWNGGQALSPEVFATFGIAIPG
ncbi:MAG: cohesin domain-containing protein [Nitrososphaerota archaeon]